MNQVLPEHQGIFTNIHEEQTKTLLKDNFLADKRPWVVTYSGGKDSTLVLQLVYEMLLSLPPEEQKPVHIMSSDTRIEAPNIEEYLYKSLSQLEQHAKSSKLDLTVHLVTPAIEESFWPLLIGKGYPPANRWFRWCTTQLKIKPVRKIIADIAAQYGSVILLMGTRKSESSSRSRRIENRSYTSRGLNQHHEIPNALVFQPIVDWTTDDVWEYLFTHNQHPGILDSGVHFSTYPFTDELKY
jgi:DNA sulfur modification protein DndC